MPSAYSHTNLQKASLADRDLRNMDFSGSDLRGGDFTGSNLAGANFSGTKTGLLPLHTVVIFVIATAFSLLSGYIAAHVSLLIRKITHSGDTATRMAGWITVGILLLGIVFTCWKGGYKSITRLLIPVAVVGVVLAVIARIYGIGTGRNLLFLSLSLLVVVVMIYIGTISRVAAGSLSNILFTIVALSGGMFGKSISGTAGPVVLALICMIISKQALKGKKDYVVLKKTAGFITSTYGTSFRKTVLTNADFSQSQLRNADLTGADLTSVDWSTTRRVNCKQDDEIITDKKKKSHDRQ